jgi:hypothetical protein
MMKLALILVVFLLSGCANTITTWEIASIQKQCEAHGGIYSIHPSYGLAYGECTDGTRVRAKRPRE